MAQTKPAGGKEWGQIIFIVNMWHLRLLMMCWMVPGWLVSDLFISFTFFFLRFVGSLKSYRWNEKGLEKGKSLQAFKCLCDYSAGREMTDCGYLVSKQKKIWWNKWAQGLFLYLPHMIVLCVFNRDFTAAANHWKEILSRVQGRIRLS